MTVLTITLSLILFALAAICNACMDKISFHFHKSVFNGLNPKFWDPSVSWKYAKVIPFTKYKIDAWHLLKSIMIICICSSWLIAATIENFSMTTMGFFVGLCLMGIIWNVFFNLFFNSVLEKDSYL